jgi:putative transposase
MQIAPSGHRRHAAGQRNPSLRCVRAHHDDTLVPEIRCVWQANFQAYGADKMWKQIDRELIRSHRRLVSLSALLRAWRMMGCGLVFLQIR